MLLEDRALVNGWLISSATDLPFLHWDRDRGWSLHWPGHKIERNSRAAVIPERYRNDHVRLWDSGERLSDLDKAALAAACVLPHLQNTEWVRARTRSSAYFFPRESYEQFLQRLLNEKATK